MTSAVVSIVALVVSIIALVYTAKTYLLKSGAHIRGSYTICSDIACEDKYVSSVTLENLKDRAIVVFKIWLKLGHNYYIEIDEFEDVPLILRPFEAFRKDYDPIDLYIASTTRVLMNSLLDRKNVKRRLVLATSDGKYVVRAQIKDWDPVIDFFKNHMTAVIRPMRSTYKGKAYGGNAKYIVQIKMEGGKEEVIPIYPGDYRIKKFRHFQLTKECMASREVLLEFLYDKVGEGVLDCADVEVHEMEEWRDRVYHMKNMDVITASYDNWLVYRVVGRVLTIVSNYRLRKKNKAAQEKHLRNAEN